MPNEPEEKPLQPQAHGGALRQGGKPGNKGGTGRPPKELRDRSRGAFERWLDWADTEINRAKRAKGKERAKHERVMLAIGKTLAQVGLPTQLELQGEGGGPVQLAVIGPGGAPAPLPAALVTQAREALDAEINGGGNG